MIQASVSTLFRRSLLVAIPVATVVGATALVYAGLNTFSAGQPLSSAAMNQNFTALQSQISALQAALGASPDGGVTSVATVPVGTVIAFAGPLSAVPAGWLACDGTLYDGTQAKYAALFGVIGTAHGGTTSLSQFNVPDYRGMFLRGVDTAGAGSRDPDSATRTAAATGGNTGNAVGSVEAQGTSRNGLALTDPGHAHTVVDGSGAIATGPALGAGTYVVPTSLSSGTTIVTTTVTPTGVTLGAGDHETRPVNAYVNYIIKY